MKTFLTSGDHFVPRRLLVVLVLSGSLVLASCGTSTGVDNSSISSTKTSPRGTKTPPGGAYQGKLFYASGTFVVPHNGAYTVLAVGGGGGGGGGGSVRNTDGVSHQVGGAGGAAGAVTINSFFGRAGQRIAIVVGGGGTPGAGGAANGGSG